MQVLIVDDSKLVLMALKGLLTDAGYDVISAGNGQEALELIRKHRCRMVISDWEMPIMTGIELCQAIRAEEFSGYIYFILLTSHGTLGEMIQGLSAGADDFIAKPYSPAEVLARLRGGERILSLETRDVAIFALAKLAESRDADTGAHLERVQHYCRTLSQQLATIPRYQNTIDAEFVRLIFQTSPLHDIGKVGMPDAILLKPGRLDPHEFEIMKSHTTIGASTLSAALDRFPGVSFLQMARDIAASHHERFDGTGYPLGLKGEDMPLCGRIIALADVYDALTSKRVYKQAFTHDSARSIILEGRGSHFDPDVVDAFLTREEQFLVIRRRFAEEEDAALRKANEALAVNETGANR
ncbi:MAG TPA: two-component system response regulator [Planctomycetaceae bacterium]|nr:two-component system response regulator [Planctomycetaceae bacterium]